MKSRSHLKVAVRGLLSLVLLSAAAFNTAMAADPDPDRYIVSFLDVAKGKAALKAAGANIQLELDRYEAAAANIPPKALKGLRNNPNIEYIEPDALRYPMAQLTPWGIEAVQADAVAYNTTDGRRKICVIDSGYAIGHEDLPNVSGTRVSGTGNWWEDSCHHGTHVAGTIAAFDNNDGVVGVIPGNVDLHIVKVFDGENCAWSYSSGLISALNICTGAGANVVSMSLGGGIKSRTEERAFADAFNAGVLSVAAAGNDGNTRKSYPASYDSVISVAAVDSALEVADFSQRNDQVELAAPGVAVRSTVAMGAGADEILTVDGIDYEAVAFEDSFQGTGSGALHPCGLGKPGDCGDASGKVCLIQRGDITFAEKVQECENAGGEAAVIYNNAEALFSGTLAGADTSIPSVAISGDNGQELAAAGGNASVTADSGNYAFYDGTSMATPHVSGVAALVWSHHQECTNAQIRNALNLTAEDRGAAGRDTAYGYGLVQAAGADTFLDFGCDGPASGGGDGEPPPPPSCTLGQVGDACSADSQCCSGTCKGKPDSKTCK